MLFDGTRIPLAVKTMRFPAARGQTDRGVGALRGALPGGDERDGKQNQQQMSEARAHRGMSGSRLLLTQLSVELCVQRF